MNCCVSKRLATQNLFTGPFSCGRQTMGCAGMPLARSFNLCSLFVPYGGIARAASPAGQTRAVVAGSPIPPVDSSLSALALAPASYPRRSK
jgi:hypothetical protein